jgi:membrane protease YdiL (CAAX protease family)
MQDSLFSKPPTDTVPWTFQQTLLGASLTLVPWLLLVFLLNDLGGKQTLTTPLSFRVDLTAAIANFILSAFIEAVFMIAPLTISTHAFPNVIQRGRLALQALGFRKTNIGRMIGWVIVLMLAIYGINILYSYLIATLHLNIQTNDQVLLAESKYAPLSVYASLLVATFIAPICEEIFFRGFLFMGLKRGMPIGWAIVISALLFAIAHGDPGSFIILFAIGLALAFLRWRTQSLWPAVLLHTVNNGLGALLIALSMWGVIH